MTELRASVRQVVEFSLHERDLSPAAFAAKRMREGAAAHKARQSVGAREETAYQAEKSLSADYAAREITLRVTGRADGLLLAADGARIVEEIKLGTAENPLVPAHRAQAAMYGHMLCQKEGLTGVRLRILYVDENGAPVRLYEEEADSARLKGEFEALCAAYCAWAERLLARRRARDASLFGLAFPYGAYRAGQRTFAANVYVAIRERKRLFAQAPTGIGKTMAALYPAALALGEGKCTRVLMLTARTTGRKITMDALAILRAHGARLLAVEIAAKDKVCPMEKRDCRPEVCPYAKGFYDRLPDALAEALTGGDWGRGQLDALAQKHTLCPFELALSLAQVADVVVCDYNYVFDPFVAIDALMQGGAALLIDEAHQLAPRVQEFGGAALPTGQIRVAGLHHLHVLHVVRKGDADVRHRVRGVPLHARLHLAGLIPTGEPYQGNQHAGHQHDQQGPQRPASPGAVPAMQLPLRRCCVVERCSRSGSSTSTSTSSSVCRSRLRHVIHSIPIRFCFCF